VQQRAVSAEEVVLPVTGPEGVKYVCSLIPRLLTGDLEEGGQILWQN